MNNHAHEWVFVSWKPFPRSSDTHWGGDVIWACPCGAFKRKGVWTDEDESRLAKEEANDLHT